MKAGPALRKFLLTVHVTASVGWIGAVLAYLPLDVATVTRDDPETLRAAYAGMRLLTDAVLVPLALAALASGVVLALVTPWGLFQGLTSSVSYAIVNAGGTRIATLTATGDTIQVFNANAASYGLWRVYRDSDLQALGSSATPVTSFSIVTNANGLTLGTFAQTLPSLPVSTTTRTLCDVATVHGFPGTIHKNAAPLAVASGGENVDLTFNWTNQAGSGEFGTFLITARLAQNSNIPQAAGASMSMSTEAGRATSLVRVQPGDLIPFACEVRGSGAVTPKNAVDVLQVVLRAG